MAEGLNVFRVEVPPSLVGVTLASSGIRRQTGCNVVAIERGGRIEGNPDTSTVLTADTCLILIGDAEAEHRFAERHPPGRRRRRAE